MRRNPLPFLAALLPLAAHAATTVSILRDEADRITNLDIADGPDDRKHVTYRLDAVPGRDLRDAPAQLIQELPFGGATVRVSGGPVDHATAQVRGDDGAPIATEPDPGPSDALLATIAMTSSNSGLFLQLQCTSISFPGADPSLGERCAALWLLTLASPHHIHLLDAATSNAFRTPPAPRTPLDEALLGCGILFATSCDEDGVDLRWADASVLHQRFPGLETALPPGGDSDVLQAVAWNWFVLNALASGVEPGTGDAAGCTFETPDGCADLHVAPQRFAARRPLADEPIDGPPLRWDWEMGTTFSLDTLEIDGSIPLATLQYLLSSLPVVVHVVGPFEGPNGAPDAVAYPMPEPLAAVATTGALAALVAVARSRRRGA